MPVTDQQQGVDVHSSDAPVQYQHVSGLPLELHPTTDPQSVPESLEVQPIMDIPSGAVPSDQSQSVVAYNGSQDSTESYSDFDSARPTHAENIDFDTDLERVNNTRESVSMVSTKNAAVIFIIMFTYSLDRFVQIRTGHIKKT